MLVMDMGRKLCVDSLTFAPDGRSLAAACSAGVFFWPSVADAVRARPLPGTRFSTNARFASGGRWLFAGHAELTRLDPATGGIVPLPLWGGYNLLFDAAPNAPYVLASQCLYSHRGGDTRIALWRANDLTPAGKVWEQDFTGYTRYAPQFLAGDDRFVRAEFVPTPGGPHPMLRVVTHDTATGAALDTSPVAEVYPYELLAAPDGRALAVRGTNQITIFPIPSSAASPAALRSDGRKYFTGMAFHPSGRFLAATNNDHTVKLFDVAAGAEVRTFTWQMGRMRSVCFSPDGALAAAGSDKGQVVVWDVDL